MDARELESGFHYFNGLPGQDFPFYKPNEGLTVHDVSRFRLICTPKGGEMTRTDEKKTFVFCLIPRKKIVKDQNWMASKHYSVLKNYIEASTGKPIDQKVQPTK